MAIPEVGRQPAASQGWRNRLVFLSLAGMTALELGLTYLGVNMLRTGLFVAISLVKAGLVALFFMHLRDDSKVYGLVFLAPVVLVLVLSLLVVAA